MKASKSPLSLLTPQYIIDKAGKRTAVVIDINAYEKLIEEVEDIYFGALAQAALEQEQKMISHKAIKRKHTGK